MTEQEEFLNGINEFSDEYLERKTEEFLDKIESEKDKMKHWNLVKRVIRDAIYYGANLVKKY